MFPSSPHTHSQTATSDKVTTNQPFNSDPPLSITDVARRSSSQTIKLASMSRSRSNSIASRRRSSRAGSRQAESLQGQAGQLVVADSGEINWDYFNGPFDYVGLDPDAADLFDGFPLEQYFPSEDEAHQQAYCDPTFVLQPQQSYNPNLVYSNDVHPALLAAQPHAQQPYMQPLDPKLLATPGLTALPSAADSMNFDSQLGVPAMQSMYSIQSSQLPYNYYPDPTMLLQQQQPYYAPATYEHQFQQFPVEQVAHESVSLPQTVGKRRRSDTGLDSDTPSKKRLRVAKSPQQESDDESDSVQSANSTGAYKGKVVRRESRESGISSSSSLGKPNQNVIKRTGQLPQKCEAKPWVRVNTATKGQTTRTDRINREAADRLKYKYPPLPHGNWQTRNGKYSFEYERTKDGIDIFKPAYMSARQISAYILKYPGDGLRLWLQVTPADSVRRYATEEHSRCMFSNCPRRVAQENGAIKHGHYRIAFDEKYNTTGLSNPNKDIDPYDCVGYVHLYCIERFCDFEAICKKKNLVKVDDRVHLPRETSHAKWTMSGRCEAGIAQFFTKVCEKGILRTTEEFKDYPVHQSSTEPKFYDGTLCKALNETALKNRTRSQIRQFVNRELKPTANMIHKGDIDLAMAEKQIRDTPAFKNWDEENQGPFNFMSHYKANYPVIYQRMQEALALRDQFEAEDKSGTARKKGKAKAAPRGKKRKVVTIIEDPDSESDVDNNHGVPSRLAQLDGYYHRDTDAESPRGTRPSLRKRARINYADEDNYSVAPQPVHPSTPPLAAPQTQYPRPDPYAEQGYKAAQQPRQLSWSEHFARIGGTLDIDNYQPGEGEEPLPTREEMDAFLSLLQERRRSSAEALQRRKSSTLSNGPYYTGITKTSQRRPSLRSPRNASGGRQASFALQPVSESKEFEIDDPPNQVASTSTRRSARLASRGS